MHFVYCRDYSHMSQIAATHFVQIHKELKAKKLCFAAGNTPKLFLQKLVEAQKQETIDFKNNLFFGLDEWLGLNAEDEGSCRTILDQAFFTPARIMASDIFFFDGKAENPDKECQRIKTIYIEKQPIDIMVLGLGLNGHLAFNEPGSPLDSEMRRISLDSSTINNFQTYTKSEAVLQPQEGISFGLQEILASRIILLLVNGKSKANALKSLLDGAVDLEVPATCLLDHPSCFTYITQDAK